MQTSMTVGPLEAHAGASWPPAGALRCAADVPSHEVPAAPVLLFLRLFSVLSCTSRARAMQSRHGRRCKGQTIGKAGIFLASVLASARALQSRLFLWQKLVSARHRSAMQG